MDCHDVLFNSISHHLSQHIHITLKKKQGKTKEREGKKKVLLQAPDKCVPAVFLASQIYQTKKKKEIARLDPT